MPYTSIGTNFHEPFNVHGNFFTQVSFDPTLFFDNLPNATHFILGQISDFGIQVDICRCTNIAGPWPSDPMNIGQADLDSFISGQINSDNARHFSPCVL